MPTVLRPEAFRHSGKLGDVIYALPGIRAVGGGRLFLHPQGEFSPADAEALLPLLRAQPYLTEAGLWEGQPFDVDFDAFREANVYWTNLADAQARLLGLPAEARDEAWLHVGEPADLGRRDVVFARSLRNHGPKGFWNRCMERYGHRAQFVGSPEEHEAFVAEFGEVPYRPTETLVELAQAIAGAALFVGNQSCPHAIAEGLKKPVVQETDLVTPNCLFLREDSLSVRSESEVDLIRTWSPKPTPRVSRETLEISPLPFGPIPSCMVVHDDWWFLREAVRSFLPAGPVTVFVSIRSWRGDDGRWDRCASEAEAAGAEVVVGDWPDEALHRRVALEEMRCRGHRHVFLPDGDEIASRELLTALAKLASVDAADVVRVSMDTYWKSPGYRIRPAERLRPVLMVDAQSARHDYIREYEGSRLLILGPDHGVLHHLSYAGPDERIRRKIGTWGHRDEVRPDWYQGVWQRWDDDRMLRDLHPTHPTFYGWTERIRIPEELAGCRDDAPALPEPEVPANWPRVSVVIPLYGGPEDIRACLASLEAFRDLVHETVVVDDASPDDAPEVLADFPWARLLRNERNLGFAGTCNRGYADSSGDVVLFLNSDTVVPRAGFVRLIESLMASGTVAAAGPRSNECAGFQKFEPAYTDVANVSLFARDFAWRDAEDRDVNLLIGFCLAVRRSALLDVGTPFDERFRRGMFEDNDLCYRLLRAGYRLRIAERAYVHHGGSHSLKRSGEPFAPLFHENRARYAEKWRDEIESGFASHLPGDRAEPIVFQPELHPDRLAREMESLRRKADVSLCMIVRDEERVLGDCLRSVQGVFSQVIVVDTGSKDRTREIALEHGAELYEFPWTESFSEARNESLRHATGRWLFWMDADDTLPRRSAEMVLRAAAMAPDDVAGFVVPVRFTDGGAAGGTQVDHVKLFRNIPGLRFEGRIHEQILGSLRETGGQIARLDAVVLHSGYDTSPAGQAKKRARDERLLKLDLEERPDHPFVLFNLGMTAHYLADHREAVDWLRRSIAVASPNESHVRKAYALMGLSQREMGDLEGALRTFAEGLAAVGDDPELRFQTALVLSAQERWAEAREQYLAMPTDVSGFFSSVDMGILGSKRFHNLGTVCLALGLYPEAQGHLAEAMRHGFAPSAQVLCEAAMERDDFRTAREAIAVWQALDPRDAGWAEAAVALAEKQGEDPEPFLMERAGSMPGAGLVLARRLLGRGEEPHNLLAALDDAGYAEAAFFRGISAIRSGKWNEALAHMKRSLALNPSHKPTKEQVGKLENALYPLTSLSRPEQVAELVGSHAGVLGPASCPLSVCVVTYHSAATVRKCLDSVLAIIGPDDEVVVVDNASGDETWEILRSIEDPRLRLHRNAENVGYAGGMNQALLLSRGEHLVLLNPDTVVFPGWVEGMRGRLSGKVALVGPVSDCIGGRQAVKHFLRSRPTRDRLAETVRLESRGVTETTKFLAGVCLMAARGTLDRYGLLDEAMEMGADDLELSWRLRVLGYELAIAGDVFVAHTGSVSFGSLDLEERRERVARSDAALVAKLRRFYAGIPMPSSWALWDSDIFDAALAGAAG